MMSFTEIINIINGKDIPPIMRGTKVMIKQLAREEKKIAEMNKNNSQAKIYSMTRPKEDMSEIFKYVKKDFNKDAYLFIK